MALCLGALVGLERQVAQEESQGEKDFPGVRTFAFLSLLGALAVLLTRELGPWLAVALFLASATFLVLRYRYDSAERGDPGYTTEIASLCTFAVGALAQAGHLLVATVITIAMVALLRSKRALHRAGELLSPADMQVLIRFLVISGIVLPLLPDEAYDPFGVLRPRDVWRMVVLISGISFVGYALMRIRLRQSSHLLTGFLGGLVSSTATAFAYARRGRGTRDTRMFEALVVLASVTAYVRISIEVAAVAPGLLVWIARPLGAMLVTGMLLGFLFHRPEVESQEQHSYENPLTLRLAFGFAGVYAVVLVLSAAARQEFADTGLYLVTGIAALWGADAPTLSLARLASASSISAEVAGRGIAIAAICTTLGKAAILLLVARGAFGLRVAATLSAMALAGIAALRWLS